MSCYISRFLLMTLIAANGGLAAEKSFANNSAELATVRKILRDTPLIDGHNDLPWQYRKHSNDFSGINLRTSTQSLKLVTDIPRLREGCVGGQFWSVYIPSEMNGPGGVKAVLEQIDVVHQLIAQYPDTFELALTAADVERIHKKGRIA